MSVDEGGVISKQMTLFALRSRRISTSLAPTNPDEPVTRIVELGVVLYPTVIMLLLLLVFVFVLSWFDDVLLVRVSAMVFVLLEVLVLIVSDVLLVVANAAVCKPDDERGTKVVMMLLLLLKQ
jgi:hypothetical protein